MKIQYLRIIYRLENIMEVLVHTLENQIVTTLIVRLAIHNGVYSLASDKTNIERVHINPTELEQKIIAYLK